MKVAIAASGTDLESTIDAHFGRCSWFWIYDTDTQTTEAVENPNSDHHTQAGCDTALWLAEQGVNTIVAGRFGSKVMDILRNRDVQLIVTEQTLTVSQVVSMIARRKP